MQTIDLPICVQPKLQHENSSDPITTGENLYRQRELDTRGSSVLECKEGAVTRRGCSLQTKTKQETEEERRKAKGHCSVYVNRCFQKIVAKVVVK